MMCATIKRILDGSRPVDQIMLVIEFLILLFILWEFTWKVWDWQKGRRKEKQYENDMAARLAGLSTEAASQLAAFVLRNDQPFLEDVLLRLAKLQLIDRNFTGWFVPIEHRDYLKRWAKKKEVQMPRHSV